MKLGKCQCLSCDRYNVEVEHCLKSGMMRYYFITVCMILFQWVEHASYALAFYYGAKLLVAGQLADAGAALTVSFAVKI